MQKLLQTKEKILEVIRQRGPELPVRVASAIGGNNLFTAAFMSELVGEQKLKMSNMRVGSSPLYYISGQEEQLQKYIDFLNHKEKEAFNLLKNEKVLQDSEQEPAIRVALRNIKDFASQIQIIKENEPKIFWKIHTLPNDEAKKLIEDKINPKIEKKQEIISKASQTPQVARELAPNKEKSLEPKKQKEDSLGIFLNTSIKKQKILKPIESKFASNIKEILTERSFEIISEILTKKKEFIAKVRTDTHLGKQELYIVAKDKKKITTDDLVNVLQKAQIEKMPAIIFSPGEIDKKAQDYYKEWRNLIKHEKIRI